MRISDWSSDVCSSDLLCSGPDVRTTLCSVHGIEQRQSAIIDHAIAIDETGPGTLQGSLKPPVPGTQAPGAGHATFPADPVIEKKTQPHDPPGTNATYVRQHEPHGVYHVRSGGQQPLDRKSTRLNSRH